MNTSLLTHSSSYESVHFREHEYWIPVAFGSHSSKQSPRFDTFKLCLNEVNK